MATAGAFELGLISTPDRCCIIALRKRYFQALFHREAALLLQEAKAL
jgi:hypothetical protein